MRAACLAAFLAVFPLCAQAQVAGGVVYATGVGVVTLRPDVARVGVSGDGRGRTASAAAADAARRYEAIVSMLERLKVPRDSVPTRYFSVRPTTDNEDRVTGYTASRSLVFLVRDLERVPMIVDSVLAAGATDIDNLSFEASDVKAAKAEAMQLAVAQAREQALALTQAAGATLGPLLELSLEPLRSGYGFGVQEITIATPSFTPQDVEVEVRVHGRWAMVGDPR